MEVSGEADPAQAQVLHEEEDDDLVSLFLLMTARLVRGYLGLRGLTAPIDGLETLTKSVIKRREVFSPAHHEHCLSSQEGSLS